MRVCVCARVPVCASACVRECLCARVHVCASACVRECLCARVPVCASACVRECLCARVPVCASACVRECLCARVPVCASACVRECLCARVPVCASACVRECLCARVSVCASACVRECLCARVPVCASACVRECLCACRSTGFGLASGIVHIKLLLCLLSFSTITDPKLPLKLNVKDKDDLLGQIVIPMNDLPSDEHFLKWVPLGSHKRNMNPTGELCLDCWIDDYHDDSDGTAISSPHSPNPIRYINKQLSRLTGRSPEPERKNYASGGTSMKGSLSVDDLSLNKRNTNTNNKSKSLMENSLLVPGSHDYSNNNLRKATSTLVLSETKRPLSDYPPLASLPTIKEQCYPPKVLNIVPNSGPTSGGTLIQITGKYLGISKEDVTRLMVAGCNCLPSLQYYTSNKIMCSTSESVGIGPISISTKSGGLSSSKLMFEFVHGKVEEPMLNGITGRWKVFCLFHCLYLSELNFRRALCTMIPPKINSAGKVELLFNISNDLFFISVLT